MQDANVKLCKLWKSVDRHNRPILSGRLNAFVKILILPIAQEREGDASFELILSQSEKDVQPRR
jgi:hypothetical protein